MRRASERR